MKDSFNKALELAVAREFEWLNDFENPFDEYEFSEDFELNMNKIIDIPTRKYVSVGSRRIRKSIAAIFIAAALLFATGCAIHFMIKWNTTQNDEQGTLDITFDIQGDNPDAPKEISIPLALDGFKIIEKQGDEKNIAIITYENTLGDYITYYCQNGVDGMSSSIDNDDATLTPGKINNYDGYYYKSNDGIYGLYWTDGVWFYSLTSNCNFQILENVARTLIP